MLGRKLVIGIAVAQLVREPFVTHNNLFLRSLDHEGSESERVHVD